MANKLIQLSDGTDSLFPKQEIITGTWTPTLLSGGDSLSVSGGRYHKCGHLVFLQMVTWDFTITNPNSSRIELSIPFTQAGGTSDRYYGQIGYYSGYTASTDWQPYIAVSTGRLVLSKGNSTNRDVGIIGTEATSVMQFSIMYLTNE